MSRRFLGRLADERGFSLAMTMLVLVVTGAILGTVVQFTSSNTRTTNLSRSDQVAYALAEAGLNNGAAVLSLPANNAFSQTLLPTTEPSETNPAHANYIKKYEGGTAKWWGTVTGSVWKMHGVGYVLNPTGGALIRREATSTIKIQPTLKQNLNNNAFNYMFAKGTAAACDVTFQNSVAVDTSLFILGDLCFENSSAVVKAAAPNLTSLVVGQKIYFNGTGAVGLSTAKISEAHVAGGCKVGSGAVTACSSATRVYADTVDGSSVVNDGGPTADFAFWYANAKPGPKQWCTTSSGGFGAYVFESSGSTTMNKSAATFNLTPGTSYTCQYYDVPPASDLLGELSWNATTKTLTVKGVFFIDGSAYISNNAANLYVGLGTLYLAGTFTIDGSARLCGAIASGDCSFSTWNPNTAMLGIITNGSDGSSGNYGVKIQNSAQFQGSLYATENVLLENFTAYDGPIVAKSFSLGNNVVTHEFPSITTVPIGWPGNPTVYAEPQPQINYAG